MEPRDKHRTRNVSGSLKKNAVGKRSASSPLYLPNIAELIEEGQITVGVLHKAWCIAPTTDITTWPCWCAEKARPWLSC